MKLGFMSAILDGWSFEEMIDTASEMGYSCVEAACWPRGAADRRYAGVSHIDVTSLDLAKAEHIRQYCADKTVDISALAYYPNIMDSDQEKRAFNSSHLKKVIEAADMLNVGTVTTFVGRDQTLNVEDNITLFKQIWPELIAYAEHYKIKIAIENCPMLFGPDQWPGGQNLATTPWIWRKLFDAIPSRYFGLNYDPSHFVWQMMDYIKPLYAFRDKIFHVHCKDIKVYPDKLDDVGITAYPLQFMSPKLPGLGDIDWSRYISALTDIGYDGYTCIEVEDRAFEESKERVLDSLRLSKRYMEQFVI